MRAHAPWTPVHGHSFLTLGGNADWAEARVSEDEYLHLFGAAFLPPVPQTSE